MSRVRALAVPVSILLHACVLILLVRPLPPEPAAPIEQVEIAINYVTKAGPPPVEPAPVARTEPVRKVLHKPVASTPTTAAPSPVAHDEPASSGSPGDSSTASASPGDGVGAGDGSGSGDGKARPADAPQELTLSLSSKAGSWAVQSGSARNRDQTWHNVPGGFPDPALEKATNEARGKRNVEGWLNDAVAEARVQSGGIDGYFFTVRDALQESAQKDADRLLSGDAKKDLVIAWQAGAQTYGKSGNPYAPGERPGASPSVDGDTPLNRWAERFPDSNAAALKQHLEMGRSLRDFADGKFSPGLLALVEVRQGGDGKLVDLTLRQPSGNVAFDAHVMKSAPEAIAPLAPPPPKGGGIHADGLHSLWSFEGKIVYKRKLSEVNLLKDGWYMALLGATGVATGTFDETTGDGEYPDFRYPHFQLKVKLLKVY